MKSVKRTSLLPFLELHLRTTPLFSYIHKTAAATVEEEEIKTFHTPQRNNAEILVYFVL